MSESGFRKLLDIGDKQIRAELQDDYYFISKNRMENYLDCLENGATKTQQLTEELNQACLRNNVLHDEIDRLKQENKRLNDYIKQTSPRVDVDCECETLKARIADISGELITTQYKLFDAQKELAEARGVLLNALH